MPDGYDQDGRRPLHPVSLAEAPPLIRLLTHVDARREEVLRHEAVDPLVGIDLGIQPSAAPSHRGSAEVEQDVPPLGLGLGEHRINVPPPCNRHRRLLAPPAT